MIAAHVLVSGIVQGVGYRWWTRRTAAELGLRGWVRNLYDGRVEIWVEGDPERVRTLITSPNLSPVFQESSLSA